MRTFLVSLWAFVVSIVPFLGLLMALARTGPDEAVSNLSKWAQKAHIHRAPEWLARKNADAFVRTWGTRAIIALVPIGLIAFVIWYNLINDDRRPPEALGIAWATARLVIVNPPVIFGFDVDGKNSSAEEVAIKGAYLISKIDGTKIRMLVGRPLYRSSLQKPQPCHLALILHSEHRSTTSPRLSSFRKWSTFSMIIECNELKIHRDFDRQWVIDQINLSHPESRPHVSPSR
jgi:hypothetical protein